MRHHNFQQQTLGHNGENRTRPMVTKTWHHEALKRLGDFTHMDLEPPRERFQPNKVNGLSRYQKGALKNRG
ncbi:MAG: hypothetical protein EBQ73_11955 [Gammaproteobacteria bacterium]|nr:hypothetical protein [Gammaproteobacteria bacterium]